jgi:hypothetical protein
LSPHGGHGFAGSMMDYEWRWRLRALKADVMRISARA